MLSAPFPSSDCAFCWVLSARADVSSGVLQLSRGLGIQSRLGQTSSRFPREADSHSHLLFYGCEMEMMQGHLARKTCRLDGRLSDPAITCRPLQYGKAPYQRISDPPACLLRARSALINRKQSARQSRASGFSSLKRCFSGNHPFKVVLVILLFI